MPAIPPLADELRDAAQPHGRKRCGARRKRKHFCFSEVLTMPMIPPLADELRDAVTLLREHRLYRAALRLEKTSANVLEPKRKSKKKTARRVGLVSGSGKIVHIKLRYDAEQIEEIP